MMTRHRVVLPLPGIEPVIGRAFPVRPNAKQRAKGIEGIEPAVKAESELVEIGLQMLVADRAVMRAGQPRLQIAENQVDDWQVFFCDIRPAGLDNGQMCEAARTELIVAVPCVRNDHGARLNRLFYKGY